jgi:hypothetical protein
MGKSSPTGIQKAIMIKKAKELQKIIMKASLYKRMKDGSK